MIIRAIASLPVLYLADSAPVSPLPVLVQVVFGAPTNISQIFDAPYIASKDHRRYPLAEIPPYDVNEVVLPRPVPHAEDHCPYVCVILVEGLLGSL